MKGFKAKIFLMLALLLFGCTTATQKQNEAIRVGVYATKDSVDASRFDLAKKYIDETSILITPPKNRVIIHSLPNKEKKNNFIVLPKNTVGDIIIENSLEYKSLLAKYKDIQKQESAQSAQFGDFTKQVGKVLQAKEEELNSAKKSSFWGWLWALLFSGGFIGILVLCIFFPAIAPIVFNIFGSIIDFFTKLIEKITHPSKQ